jgi:preprotein translocase subunit SecD
MNAAVLEMALTDAGDRRLRKVTAAHVGRRMALLVEGRVRSAPVIAQEIGSRPAFQVAIDAPAGEAEEIAGRIRARWPSAGH